MQKLMFEDELTNTDLNDRLIGTMGRGKGIAGNTKVLYYCEIINYDQLPSCFGFI